jgi:hypothetical protein
VEYGAERQKSRVQWQQQHHKKQKKANIEQQYSIDLLLSNRALLPLLLTFPTKLHIHGTRQECGGGSGGFFFMGSSAVIIF